LLRADKAQQILVLLLKCWSYSQSEVQPAIASLKQ
jgi:hypothetical protein